MKTDKNFIIIICLLMLVAGLTVFLSLFGNSKPAQEAQMSSFPLTIGEWQGKDVPLDKSAYEILATHNLIMREYHAPNQPIVYLYIIYSSGNKKSIHPPEICYTGGGNTMIEKSVIPLTGSITANKFITDEKNSQQLVVYWFRTNGLNTYSFIKQQFQTALNRTFGKKTSGAMVRISTVIEKGKGEGGVSLIKSFCRQIEPLLDRYVP